MMDKPFQRKGGKSNTAVGAAFETIAKEHFAATGLNLEPEFSVAIGVRGTKAHNFDLGCSDPKILIECKSHTWTEGSNVPSAKMTTWDQAMYYFHCAPAGYRKIFFVLRDYCERRKETLADYYVRTHLHLIPNEVEFWEYDESNGNANQMPLR